MRKRMSMDEPQTSNLEDHIHYAFEDYASLHRDLNDIDSQDMADNIGDYLRTKFTIIPIVEK
jgi:hypothetical protein